MDNNDNQKYKKKYKELKQKYKDLEIEKNTQLKQMGEMFNTMKTTLTKKIIDIEDYKKQLLVYETDIIESREKYDKIQIDNFISDMFSKIIIKQIKSFIGTKIYNEFRENIKKTLKPNIKINDSILYNYFFNNKEHNFPLFFSDEQISYEEFNELYNLKLERNKKSHPSNTRINEIIILMNNEYKDKYNKNKFKYILSKYH